MKIKKYRKTCSREKCPYYRKETRQVAIEFNMDKESDLYNFLSSKGNKQGYIKEMLRKALEKSTPLEKERWINI